MALYPARGGQNHRSTRSSASTTMTARKPAPAATACAASPRWSARKPASAKLDVRDRGRPDCLLARRRRPASRSTWARRACAGTRSRWPRNSPTRARSSWRSGRSTRRSCIRPRSSAWAIRMRSSGSTIRRPMISAKIGPLLENHPIFPGARQHHARRDAVARSHRDPHLGARRRPDQGLRLGGLRRRGRRGAARAHRPQGDGHAARRRSRHRMARERRPCADDRAGRIRAQGPLRCGAVRRRGQRR